MTAAFKELWSEMGVDEETAPAGAMIPYKGKNFVRLMGKGKYRLDYDRTRLKVTRIRGLKKRAGTILAQARSALGRDDPLFGPGWEAIFDTARLLQAQTLTEGDLYAIEGRRKGMTRIEAIDTSNRRTAAKLLVTVHPKTEFDVTFHFVRDRDENGRPRMRTKWTPASVANWVNVLNGIFTPQANIVLRNHNSAVFDVDKDYGHSVDVEEIRDLGRRVKRRSHIDVFLVGSFTGGSDPSGAHVKGTHEIVCDNRPTEELQLQTISHEIGHRLGAHHVSGRVAAKRHWLMSGSPRHGSKITHQWALDINPW